MHSGGTTDHLWTAESVLLASYGFAGWKGNLVGGKTKESCQSQFSGPDWLNEMAAVKPAPNKINMDFCGSGQRVWDWRLVPVEKSCMFPSMKSEDWKINNLTRIKFEEAGLTTLDSLHYF